MEGCLPGAVALNGCFKGLVAKGDAYRFPGMAPAPDWDGLIPLKDHVGSEDSGKRNLGGKGGGKREEETGKKARGLVAADHEV